MLVSLVLLRSLLFPNCLAVVYRHMVVCPCCLLLLTRHSSTLLTSVPCKPFLARATLTCCRFLWANRHSTTWHHLNMLPSCSYDTSSLGFCGTCSPPGLLPALLAATWPLVWPSFLLSISEVFLFIITLSWALSVPVSLDLTLVGVFPLGACSLCGACLLACLSCCGLQASEHRSGVSCSPAGHDSCVST